MASLTGTPSTSSNPPSTSSYPSSFPAAFPDSTPSPYFPIPFHLQKQPDAAQSSSPADPYFYQNSYPLPQIPPPQTAAKISAPPVQPQLYPSAYPAAPVVGSVYTLPQYQQAQQLFQRDAQTITPEALESVKAAIASSEIEHKAETKKKALPRKAAGRSWEDPTLSEWPENDFRLFCGDLGNEVNDEVLSKAFTRFPSFNMAKVVRDKRTGKTRGYGFVSFSSPLDLASAMKEMNGKYVGNRPIKLRKSNWKERTDYDALDRQKHHTQKKPKLSKKSVLHK